MQNKTFTAALVIIGNEILSGRTQDANTAWLAARLVKRGIVMREVRIVPDEPGAIIATLNALRANVDYVFTTGGIGPTHDDITAENVAKAFGVELELNPAAYTMLLAHYGQEAEITPPRRKMAMIPAGASLIPNPVSGAPGFVIGNVHVMAGVPKIMQAMFDAVEGTLAEGTPVLSQTVMCALPESKIADGLAAIQGRYEGVDIGSYPNYRGGTPGVSVVVRSTIRESVKGATQDVIDLIHSLGVEPTAVTYSDE